MRWENNWHCLDCYRDTYAEEEHYYMVEEHVWMVANPGIVGNLCLFCLRRRLQRDLTMEDFTEYNVNSHINKDFLGTINSRFRL
jgi:hypothetical protein